MIRTLTMAIPVALLIATTPAWAETMSSPTMGCTIISDAQMFGHLRDADDRPAQVRFQQEKYAAKLCDLYERGTQVQITQRLQPTGELPLVCVRRTGATSCQWIRSVYLKEFQP